MQIIQVPSLLDEVALLKIIDTIQSLLNLFQQQINNNMKVLILVGVTGSGKSTIFNLLGGAKFKLIESEDGIEELDLEQITSEFSVMKGGMQSVTKEPNYYINKEFNHLLIDFPGFQDTNGELDQIMIQMLFYKISTQSKVKILYVIRHPELEFQERGTNLQEFIRTTFKEQSIGIESLSLLLNAFNEENFSDEEVKASAKDQLYQQYNVDCNNVNVIVLRKINEKEDIEKQFSEENRKKIWEDVIKSKEINFEPIQILHTEKISSYLSGKSFQYIEGVCSSISQKLTQKYQNAQQNDISSLNNLSSMFQELPQRKNNDFVEWFEKFASVSAKIAQKLDCLQEVKQKSEEFKKIYLFFQQFSNFINGYYECLKNSDFANAQYHDMIKIISNKIDFIKEKQKVEQTTAEKDLEIELKIQSIVEAAGQRNLQEKYKSQQRQVQSETDKLNQKINWQRYEMRDLYEQTSLLRNKYDQLKVESERVDKELNSKIDQALKSKKETEIILEKKNKQLKEIQKKQDDQLKSFQKDLEIQKIKKGEIMKQIFKIENEINQQQRNLGAIQQQNSNLRREAERQRQSMYELQNDLMRARENQYKNNGCQLI